MKAEVLYQILRAQIEAERYPVGAPLPPEQALGAEYQAARGTVRAALQRLADEGYIRAGQGRQRVVQRRQPLRLERIPIPSVVVPGQTVPARRQPTAPGLPSLGGYLKQAGLEPEDIVLQSATRQPCQALAREPRFDQPIPVSDELQISPQSEVISFLRVRQARNEALCLQWAVVPAAILPVVPLASLVPGGVAELYQQRQIVRLRLRATYAPTRASKQEADYLRLSPGAPLLEERRVSYALNPKSGSEQPYEYMVTLYTEQVALVLDWLDPRYTPPRKRSGARR
jgi:GntR family transcriptional regulator